MVDVAERIAVQGVDIPCEEGPPSSLRWRTQMNRAPPMFSRD